MGVKDFFLEWVVCLLMCKQCGWNDNFICWSSIFVSVVVKDLLLKLMGVKEFFLEWVVCLLMCKQCGWNDNFVCWSSLLCVLLSKTYSVNWWVSKSFPWNEFLAYWCVNSVDGMLNLSVEAGFVCVLLSNIDYFNKLVDYSCHHIIDKCMKWRIFPWKSPAVCVFVKQEFLLRDDLLLIYVIISVFKVLVYCCQKVLHGSMIFNVFHKWMCRYESMTDFRGNISVHRILSSYMAVEVS